MENIKKAIRYIFIPFIVLLFFKAPLESALLTFIINPLFSKISTSFWLYDLAILSISIISIFLGNEKIKRGARIPNSWILIYISYLIVYIFYRCTNHPFSYISFSFKEELKLLDLLNGIPLILIILDYKNRFKLKRNKSSDFKETNSTINNGETNDLEEEDKEPNIQGFAVDEPVTINKDYDILNRMKFIKNLSQMILKTDSKNGSFPIGIVAPWGSGKTTFISALKDQLEEDLIVIELDVWTCKSTDQIIESFFELLKQKLKPFSFTINNKIRDYSKSLTSSSGNAIIESLSKPFFSNKPAEQQYEHLKKEIEIINKKVVVIIDDIDRLNKKEIYEVIRLVRNTANFSNIFFIVAYDRNYILNAIEAINPYNAHTFLEKVFQVEFSLSPIEGKTLISEIKNRIEPILSKDDKIGSDNFNKDDLQYLYNRVDLTSSFILNMRDVVRFVNLFNLNYQFVKNEIYFEDFYNLQLIRFKHPEIFLDFYKKYFSFLDSNTLGNDYTEKKYHYQIKFIQKGPNPNKNTISEFESFLENQRQIYKLNDNEIKVILTSFLMIFPPHDNNKYSRNNCNFYSVIKPSMFDRYFTLGIEGKLSKVEFSKARNLNTELFIEKILEWGKQTNLQTELIDHLFTIKDFDDIEDFEKIIKANFALGEIVNFDLSYLQKMMMSEDNKVLDIYYNRDTEKFKTFFISLFNNAKSPFLFAARLIHFLDKNYFERGLFVISKEKLNDFSIRYLKTYSSKLQKIDFRIWDLFWDCKRTNFLKGSNDNEIPKEAKEIMKDFIVSKDLDNYLTERIDDEPFNNKRVRISNSILDLFTSWESFEVFLIEQDENKWKYLEEFKRFFIKAKKSGFNTYIEFNFEKITVKFRKRP